MAKARSFTRWRRPFLAPIWLSLVLVAAAAAAAWLFFQNAETTTIVIVRTAADGPAAVGASPLLHDGETQAERLASLFGTAGAAARIKAIYVADVRGVEQMAAPLAARLGLQPIVFPSASAQDVPARALDEHGGDCVMIIASGSAAGGMVEALSGIQVAPLKGAENGAIYIVSVPALGNAGVLQLDY